MLLLSALKLSMEKNINFLICEEKFDTGLKKIGNTEKLLIWINFSFLSCAKGGLAATVCPPISKVWLDELDLNYMEM